MRFEFVLIFRDLEFYCFLKYIVRVDIYLWGFSDKWSLSLSLFCGGYKVFVNLFFGYLF